MKIKNSAYIQASFVSVEDLDPVKYLDCDEEWEVMDWLREDLFYSKLPIELEVDDVIEQEFEGLDEFLAEWRKLKNNEE